MSAPIRPALVLAIAFLLVVSIVGLRFTCVPASLRQLIQEDCRREQLRQFERSTFRHMEAKEQVFRKVIVQRCSLSEGLARLHKLDLEWLQELDREWPNAAIGMSESYRVASSYPDYYYRFITWRTPELLSDRPEEASAVLHRLEEDYQQLRTSRQTLTTGSMKQTGPSR